MKKVKKEKEEKTMKLKDLVSFFKGISVVFMVISVLCLFTTFVGSCYAGYTVATKSTDVILKDEITIDYLEGFNSLTKEEAKELVTNMDSKAETIIFDIVIPGLFVLVFLIALYKTNEGLHDFVKGVKSNKALFTKEKFSQLKKVRSYFDCASLLYILNFNLNILFILVLIVLSLSFEAIIYLFGYCVKKENA